jgi:uncharacterized membrane protein
MNWNTDIVQPLLRWMHVLAGILWIGHLYFFNFVNAHLAKTYDADSKKKVIPELMPRALYWFRWGAAWTWITGFLMLMLIYYHGQLMQKDEFSMDNNTASLVALGIIIIIFFIYDAFWKAMKNEKAGAVISYLAVVAIIYATSQIFAPRAAWIHLGAFFGTIMAMNVWMRIWPAQKKIIAGIKGTGPAPDPSVAASAGLRSKHNTYMSVPLLFAMISNHYATLYGDRNGWIYLSVIVLLGWLLTRWLYIKSGGANTVAIGSAGTKEA